MIIFTIINFILILLVILFTIILYSKFSNVQRLEQEYRQLLSEAEESISGFIMELKEENDRFLKNMTNKNGEREVSNEKNTSQHFHEIEENLTLTDVTELLSENNNELNKEPKEMSFEELSLKEQAILLRERGYSIEETARKLNKGKTEIELLLKFQH
ncbi:hypothetical protein FIU87_09555 [Bacillus sp. THAF10]|nr:hypothetical protein FIU87_09555 [Bacillus sp. THAF10]